MTRLAALTADELLHMNLPNKRTELVRGQLIVREPAGFMHGEVAGNVYFEVATFVRARDLGVVLAAETGFKLFKTPDTVRAADVAFVHRDRLPDPIPTGYADFAPDLAVEVRSPDDRAGDIADKVADWLGAGTRLIWSIDPRTRTARVYRADGTETAIASDGAIDGEDVLPGFSLPLLQVLR